MKNPSINEKSINQRKIHQSTKKSINQRKIHQSTKNPLMSGAFVVLGYKKKSAAQNFTNPL